MKKYKLSDEEKNLFRETVGPVKKIVVAALPNSTKPIVKTRVKQPIFEDPKILIASHYLDPVGREDHLFFAKDGVAPKTLRQLKQGQLYCQAELDLHHLTISEAESMLYDFIKISLAQGLRHVRIVHGKGSSNSNPHPALKNQVNNWLRNHSDVLAFCSAQNKDGGTGAVYVLLKRKM